MPAPSARVKKDSATGKNMHSTRTHGSAAPASLQCRGPGMPSPGCRMWGPHMRAMAKRRGESKRGRQKWTRGAVLLPTGTCAGKKLISVPACFQVMPPKSRRSGEPQGMRSAGRTAKTPSTLPWRSPFAHVPATRMNTPHPYSDSVEGNPQNSRPAKTPCCGVALLNTNCGSSATRCSLPSFPPLPGPWRRT